MKKIIFIFLFVCFLALGTSCFKTEIYSFQEGIYEFDKEAYRKAIDLEEMEEFIEDYEVETFSMVFKKITEEEFLKQEKIYNVLETKKNKEYYFVKFIIKFKDLDEEIDTSFQLGFRYEAGRAFSVKLNMKCNQFELENFKMQLFLYSDYKSEDPKIPIISVSSKEQRNELRHTFSVTLKYVGKEIKE